MQTSREDVGITIRSALLSKGTKQKFSLFVLIILSIILIFIDNIESKPLNFTRSIIKDVVYRTSLLISAPEKSFKYTNNIIRDHFKLYNDYNSLKKNYEILKKKNTNTEFLELENNQLRQLIDDKISSPSDIVSARVMIDKQSPYLNSFIINVGSNKDIKNGMAVLNGDNFIGRIVDVNFFSSRVLLITDLNSKIPVIIEPSASHAILSGRGNRKPTLEYLPENYKIQEGDKVFTSGKEGIFSPGIPIGEVKIDDNLIKVLLFSDLNQITFISINLGNKKEIETTW